MGIWDTLWGRTATEEQTRFAPEHPLTKAVANTLSYMPIQAAAVAMEHGYDKDRFLRTRYFGGYLYGFLTYFEDRNYSDGEVLRTRAFATFFGHYEGCYLLGKIEEHLDSRDPQTVAGATAGEQDGNRYYEASLRGDNPGLGIALRVALERRAVDEAKTP